MWMTFDWKGGLLLFVVVFCLGSLVYTVGLFATEFPKMTAALIALYFLLSFICGIVPMEVF